MIKLEDVLLSGKEANNTCKQFQKEHWLECDNYETCQDCPILKQAQCLKLLKWGRQICREHNSYQRFSCSECLLELEKLLRGK